MGGAAGKSYPPLREEDLRTLLAYNLRGEHISKMWTKFREADNHFNGAWTVSEMYKVIQEPRLSMRAPIIDSLFFMGDGTGDGSVNFEDYLVMFCSYCALSREEVLQLLFIIIDRDRNGLLEKEELNDFFDYKPPGLTGREEPVFPVNNKSALERFRKGNWEALEFDGFGMLCEEFPYIAYPCYHTQELYRKQFLGLAFWEKLDAFRDRSVASTKTRKVRLPGSNRRIEVRMPGRCTMQELLEYSRRKTALHAGRRVPAFERENAKKRSAQTQERDQQIETCPILLLIRNPRCQYHIPQGVKASRNAASEKRPELEVEPSAEEEVMVSTVNLTQVEGAPPGVMLNATGYMPQADLDLLELAARGDISEAEEDDEGSEDWSDEDESEYSERRGSRPQ